MPSEGFLRSAGCTLLLGRDLGETKCQERVARGKSWACNSSTGHQLQPGAAGDLKRGVRNPDSAVLVPL